MLGAGDIVHLAVTGSYITVNRFYRLQGVLCFLGHEQVSSWGLRQTLLGNPDFRRQQHGLAVTSIPLVYNMTLTAHGGYQQHKSLA
jgi:hypothetical protein